MCRFCSSAAYLLKQTLIVGNRVPASEIEDSILVISMANFSYLDNPNLPVIPQLKTFGGFWLCPPAAAVLNKKRIVIDENTRYTSHPRHTGAPKMPIPFEVIVFPIMPDQYAKLIKDNGVDAAESNSLQDVGEEIVAMINMCVALSCKNIHLGKIPAPIKLNKKRVKKGKYPIPESHTIMIETNTSLAATGHNKQGAEHGIRQSPSSHWRRGHIRRLPSGERTWVSPAIINAENVNTKHYSLC